MPKEHKKRGRREEKKRKREEQEEVEYAPEDTPQKKSKTSDDAAVELPAPDDVVEGIPNPAEITYYGRLDDEEQDYFKLAEETLELDQFTDPEEKAMFITTLHQKAEGKELKLIHSQGCSRLMEKLISLSTPAQLKSLFQKFSGHFLPIVQHRFASHCCEALFIHAAPVVSQEIDGELDTAAPQDPNEIYVTMENLFLAAAGELQDNLSFLITDRFASHPLRVLLVVLSGFPLNSTKGRSLLHSKKKEGLVLNNPPSTNGKVAEKEAEKRVVPESFKEITARILNEGVTRDTTYLRALATHQVGNPILQLLLQLELSEKGSVKAKDEDSILRRLLPDDTFSDGSDSEQFVKGIIYDPVGSRLMESIVEHVPGKFFKSLYRGFFKDRMAQFARNETASYVASKVLERLSKDDLEEALVLINPEVPNLVERGRTSVIKTLIDRCVIRGVDTTPLASTLESSYSGTNGFEIARLLRLAESSVASESASSPQPKKHKRAPSSVASPDRTHNSLLAQSMLSVPGPLSGMVFDSLARLSTPLSISIARDPFASRTLQAALRSPEASVIFRRKIIQQFYGHIGELALDPSASHVIDAVWAGTTGLAFIRERVAEELAENEAALRESSVGRNVWRNWEMDLYRRRRDQWVKRSQTNAGNDGFMSFNDLKSSQGDDRKDNDQAKKHKSALDRARERHYAEKKGKEKDKGKGKGKARSSKDRDQRHESKEKDKENKAESEHEHVNSGGPTPPASAEAAVA